MTERLAGNIWSDVFAGGGVGLLLGTVMGLTTAPVVTVVVGALASLLGVLMGLDGSGPAEGRRLRVNGARIGALGAAAVIGFGLGLYVRINNPLAEPPATQLARWNEALPDDPTLAKQIMLYERTGIAPAEFAFGRVERDTPVSVSVNQEMAQARSAVLFSTLTDFDACSRLDPRDYGTPEDVLAVYTRINAPSLLGELKTEIERLPAEQQVVAVSVAHRTLCLVQEAEASAR